MVRSYRWYVDPSKLDSLTGAPCSGESIGARSLNRRRLLTKHVGITMDSDGLASCPFRVWQIGCQGWSLFGRFLGVWFGEHRVSTSLPRGNWILILLVAPYSCTSASGVGTTETVEFFLEIGRDFRLGEMRTCGQETILHFRCQFREA